MAVNLNLHDLQFVLKQIKIAEAHANGAALTEIRLDPAGNVIVDPAAYGPDGTYLGDPGAPRAIPDPHTPFGLRTVDGTYNNIVPGRETWGAADQVFPRLLEPEWREGSGSVGFGPGGVIQFDQNDYTPGTPLPPGTPGMIQPGSVADAEPRLISNLIADMTPNNPAAIVAALQHAESENIQEDLATLAEAWAQTKLDAAALQEAVDNALDALNNAQAALDDALLAYQNDPTTIEAVLEAVAAYTEARDAHDAAVAAQTDPMAHFISVAEGLGLEIDGTGSIVIPNVAPDEGLSAPFNSWMTFFGQFFDHGLDLVSKGGNGTIYIPLQPDDPLYVEGSPTNFMALTRATQIDDTEARNVTTPFVDQNQTYTSHPSHQVFLREYTTDSSGKTVATGRLLEGTGLGGSTSLATWADVKANALEHLGIQLEDVDATSVPLIRTDLYGKFIPDPVTGYAQVITGVGPDGIPNTADDIVISGTPDNPVTLSSAIRTNHAFLDDIAHFANPGTLVAPRAQDDDDAIGYSGDFSMGNPTSYDNELLDRHFVTGDGRGNENIALSAVHHVFHSEHNRQVSINKYTILKDGDLAFVNDWLVTDLTAGQLALIKIQLANTTDKAAYIDNVLNLDWDGERLFQAARFATEMQYQHLVFEEFARRIQPNIDPFVFNSVTDINPAIFAEFAHTVYRFGHSMLTESVQRTFWDVDENEASFGDLGLIEAFLNPLQFSSTGSEAFGPNGEFLGSDAADLTADQAAGAIARAMTRQHGNEIDEFVVDAVRNNLLGLPLDLAAINIARGRDTGVPSLNEARSQLYAASNSSWLQPYTSWADFAANLKTPASIINFIAAYGRHQSILDAETAADKRDAAFLLVFGGEGAPADRLDFLHSTGAWAAQETGFNLVDFWIGGLAEKIMPFGGMLGSTFSAVFELQLENLQDGDRFYYLTRTQGLNFLNALEENAFAKMIMANTDLTAAGPDGLRGTEDDLIYQYIGIDAFSLYDYMFEVDLAKQIGEDPDEGVDPWLAALGYTQVVRDAAQIGFNLPSFYDNFFRYVGGEHVSIGGTQDNDWIIGGDGDDSIWGGAGNDRIEGGHGVDLINGGPGDDIITDMGDSEDFIKGEEGDDVIANSNGIDVVMGGSGKDVIFVGIDDTHVFGGSGDDFILGGLGVDFLMGNEGDDWIEGGGGFDTIAGDNSELFFNSRIIGHDVMFAGSDEQDFDAESGDDIMVQGPGPGQRNEGMFGFDWVAFKGVEKDAFANMNIRIFTTEEADILRNRFDKVEALSGWDYNDHLIGDNRVHGEFPEFATVNNTETIFYRDELDLAGRARIAGLDRIVTDDLMFIGMYGSDFSDTQQVIFSGGNILLGGGGSDLIEGRGGNDIIDGDAWLNVRIRITAPGAENTVGNQIATVDSLSHTFTGDEGPGAAAWAGRSLFELMIDRVIVPSQLHIVREILYNEENLDGTIAADVAMYWDIFGNYLVESEVDSFGRERWIVDHTGFDDNNLPEGQGGMFVSDGRDVLYNIEFIQFADGYLNTVTGEFTPGEFEPEEPAPENSVPVPSSADEIHPRAPFTNEPLDPLAVGEVYFGLFDQGTDADPDTLDYFVFTGAPIIGGSVDILDATLGLFMFTPDAGFEGVASFFYVIRDYDEVDDDFQPIYKSTSEPKQVFIHYGNAVPPPAPGSADFTVDEFAATGTLVGLFTALEEGSFSLVDDAGGRFMLVGNELFVANGLLLDFEQWDTHSILVESSNGDQTSFMIAVNDVDEEVVVGDNGSYKFVGGAGNDTLTSGLGLYTLEGGLGDDTYYVNNATDEVIEEVGGGEDTIFASVSYVLQEGSEVEHLHANAGKKNLILTGNSFDNTFYSGAGVDTLQGGLGDDVYYVNNKTDKVIEHAGEGIDRVYASVTYALTPNSHVEFLYADAGTKAITLSGNALNNTLYAGQGNTTMKGGYGDDVYYVNKAGDKVVEGKANGGIDTVYASASWALGAGSRVENLVAAGVVGITLKGNAFANHLYSAAGLEDLLQGGAGSDFYYVNDAGDRVLEGKGKGTDTVYASVDWTLEAGSHVEILRADAGSDGITLTGNELANRFYSGDGLDTLIGGRGNDTYYVNDAGDRVLENAGEGTDTVHASVSYALEAGSHVEFLRAEVGTADIDLTGNELANTVVGNAGSNVIAGGFGNDTLTGGAGEDFFLFDTALDAQNNVDRITDFNVAADTIWLDKSIFTAFAGVPSGTAISAENLRAANGATSALEEDQYLIYNRSNGALFYDADGSGDEHAAIRFATLSAGLNLTFADFVII